MPSGDGDESSSGAGDESGEPPATTTSATSAGTSTTDPTGDDADVTGDDAGDSSTGGTDDGSTGSTDDGPLACTGICVGAIAGWNGPVTLVVDEHARPPCADPAYDQLAVSGYGGVVAPEAQCECECTVGEEAECAATLASFTTNSCFAIEESWDLVPGCNAIGAAGGDFEIDYEASGGACDPSPSVELPPFDVSDHVAACGTMAQTDGVCEGDQECVPAPADAAPLCWWSDGDVPCPDLLDGTREVIYTEDAFDSRGCDECTCNAASGACEETFAYLVSNGGCQLIPPGFLGIVEDDCTSFGTVQSLLLGAPTATTTCTPTGVPAANGSVDPQGPVTVCCNG